MKQPKLLNDAAKFHGHLGPWLALGLRAGRRAAAVLGSDPFRLRAVVHCPPRTPYTCFIDGIQFSSGCTLGKGNVRHVRSTRVWVEFTSHAASVSRFMPGKVGDRQAGLKLELQPDLWTELVLEPARGKAAIENMARTIFRRPLGSLFIETR